MIEFYSEHQTVIASQIEPIRPAFLFLLENETHKEIESINVVIVTDDLILETNQQYLNHDYYTDIITFELNSDPLIAELYISFDTVRSNAKKHQTSLNEELKRVLFHGLLHLCGYNDKTEEEQILMKQKENHYLHQFSTLKLVD